MVASDGIEDIGETKRGTLGVCCGGGATEAKMSSVFKLEKLELAEGVTAVALLPTKLGSLVMTIGLTPC